MNSTIQGKSRSFLTLLFLVVFGSVFAVGCDSLSPDNPNNNAPNNNGQRSFSARVSGLENQPNLSLSGTPALKEARGQEYLGESFSGMYIALSGKDEAGKDAFINFFYCLDEDLAVGTYTIGGIPDENSTEPAADFLADYIQELDNEERLFLADGGSITLNSVTKEEIVGEFRFTAKDYYSFKLDVNSDTTTGFIEEMDDFELQQLDNPITIEGTFKAEVVDGMWSICVEENGSDDGDADCAPFEIGEDFDTDRFGSPYYILEGWDDGFADSTGVVEDDFEDPKLENNSLVAWVEPLCTGGTFELRYEVKNDTSELRLFHNNNADLDTCDFSPDGPLKLTVDVPAEARSTNKITLLNPDPIFGDADGGFVLK